MPKIFGAKLILMASEHRSFAAILQSLTGFFNLFFRFPRRTYCLFVYNCKRRMRESQGENNPNFFSRSLIWKKKWHHETESYYYYSSNAQILFVLWQVSSDVWAFLLIASGNRIALRNFIGCDQYLRLILLNVTIANIEIKNK